MEENNCIEPIIITKNTIQYMNNLEQKYKEIYEKIRKEIQAELKLLK
tara:strand:- start:321 stop:461 length:141 start_codon:yes stop_codon:yes gene_type:complete